MKVSIDDNMILVEHATAIELEHARNLIHDLFWEQDIACEISGNLYLWDGKLHPFLATLDHAVVASHASGPMYGMQVPRKSPPIGIKELCIVSQDHGYLACPVPFDESRETDSWYWPKIWYHPLGPQKMSGSERLYRMFTTEE